MVNTESFDALNPSAGLGRALAAAVGAFVSRLGQCLVDEAGLESLFRITNLPLGGSLPELVSLLHDLEAMLGSALVTDYALTVGFQTVADALQGLSREAASHLAGRARRHLNSVTALPPLASEASFLVEQLELGSLLDGAHSALVREKWTAIVGAGQKKLDDICLRDRVRLNELATFLTPELSRDLRFFVHLACASAENLGAVLGKGAEPDLGSRPVTCGETLLGMVAFERRKRELARLSESVDRLQAGEPWRRARRALASGQMVTSLLWLDSGLQDAASALGALRVVEPTGVGMSAPQRFLEGENYLYVRSLSRHLIVAGESPRDVEKAAALLFEYVSKNNVPCLEVLDEEILSLHPNIRRESLVKARLEVRLNDTDFPLSVAHKDWIQRTVKAL